jgi:hypothetical protein
MAKTRPQQHMNGWLIETGTWERRWGYCAPRGTCPGSPTPCSGHGSCDTTTALCTCEKGWIGNGCSEKMRLVTEGVYQTKGSICQFPFTFNGTEFTECAVDAAHQNKPYCATKAGNLDEHGQWDFCAEAGTCPGIIPCSERYVNFN